MIDLGYDPSPTAPLDLDNPFLSFDEFTQNVLADNNYFSFEPHPGQDGLPGDTASVANLTPFTGSYDTPQTAFATNLGLSEPPQQLEVTPLVERSVELFFVHLYPTYPLLSKDVVLVWLQNPLMLSKSEQVLVWSICAATLVSLAKSTYHSASLSNSSRLTRRL